MVDSPWWNDHQNLALTAAFMFRQGHSEGDVIYMLEKPWKHDDDFALAQAEVSLPEDLNG